MFRLATPRMRRYVMVPYLNNDDLYSKLENTQQNFLKLFYVV